MGIGGSLIETHGALLISAEFFMSGQLVLFDKIEPPAVAGFLLQGVALKNPAKHAGFRALSQ